VETFNINLMNSRTNLGLASCFMLNYMSYLRDKYALLLLTLVTKLITDKFTKSNLYKCI